MRIEWTCDPTRVDALVQRVFQEIDFVKSTRIGTAQMGRVRETLRREYEANSQDNRYLLNQISQAYEDGDGSDLPAVLNVPEQIQGLSGDAVQQAAQTYLDMTRYVKVVLMPEKRLP